MSAPKPSPNAEVPSTKSEVVQAPGVALAVGTAQGASLGGGPVAAAKEWAVFVYMRPDASLELPAIRDIEEMTRATTGTDVHVIVQVDHTNDRQRRRIVEGKAELVQRFRPRRSTPLADLGEFIAWASEAYPSHKRLLVIWGHARGVGVDLVGPSAEPLATTPAFGPRPAPSSAPRPRSDALSFLDLIDVSGRVAPRPARPVTGTQMFPAVAPIDLLGLDSCFMSSVEFAHELHGCVGHMVASQSYMKMDGWNYAVILEALTKCPDMSVEDLAKTIVRHVDQLDGDTNLAHLVLQKSPALVEKFRVLVCLLQEAVRDPRAANALAIQLKRANYLKVRQFLDLRDVCHKIADLFDGEITAAANAVLDEYEGFVAQARGLGRTIGHLFGVSLYYANVEADLPLGNAAPDADAIVDPYEYEQLAFVRDTGWLRLVTTLAPFPILPCPNR
jgi:cysteine peptidase C11 family protein